jgi:4-amino-4-deoxy-L-arabinose transferase-like glycosyltransferase
MKSRFRLASSLWVILIVAAALRLVATFFSTGYLMHDDHFLVLEAAGSWRDGEDYNLWFPWNQEAAGVPIGPHPANFAYVGTQYLFLLALDAAGITDPADLAFIIRLLHGLYSLLIPWLGWKMARQMGGESAASIVGWSLAALAWMPLLSVHQLVEMVCIPPMMFAFWTLLKVPRQEWAIRHLLLAGAWLGLATGLRYQLGILAVGWGVALLWDESGKRNVRYFQELIPLALGAIVIFSLTQIADLWVWGEPFVQLRAYFGYNTTHATAYPQGPWYQYFLTLAGLLIPPVSLAWMYGTGKSTRKWLWVALPILFFFAFHSIYSNKQERFILPIVPMIILLGTLGWQEFISQKSPDSAWWKWQRWGLRFSLFVNVLGLIFLTPAAFKTARVTAMEILFRRGDLENFVAVEVDSASMPPRFYSGEWSPYYAHSMAANPANEKKVMCRNTARPFPNYLLFYGDERIAGRVEEYKQVYTSMEYIGQAAPGKWDRLLAWLNPINQAERVMIYRINPAVECPVRYAFH